MVPYTLPSQKRSDAPLLIRDKRLASAAGHYARVELVRTELVPENWTGG
jgi:hypothetical protein